MRAKGSLVLVLAVAVAVTVTLPAFGADWLAYRNGPERRNATAEAFATPLSLVWKFTTAASSQRVPPAVTADRVFCAAGSYVYCLDVATGAGLWSYDAGDTILAAPAFADGRVFLGADNTKVVCLNADDGKEIWAVTAARAIRAAPVVVDGVVYATSLDRRAMAIDAATGARRWSTQLTDELWGAPAVSGGFVFVPTADAQLFALDTDDGKIRRQITMPRRKALIHPVVVTDDALYVAGRSDVTALNRRGTERWAVDFNTFLTGAPAVAHGRLYISLVDGRVLALDVEKGKTLWEFPFNTLMSTPPTVVGDVVIVGAVGGMVYALDAATGLPRWRYLARPPGLAAGTKADFDLAAPAVYSNGSLYLVWDDGNLARFDANWPDISPPTIRLLTPRENMVTGITLPKLVGAQVFDEQSGLDLADLAMSLDDAPVEAEYDPYSGHYTYTIDDQSAFAPLKSGWHALSVTARDQRGNETTRQWRFFAQPGGEAAEETETAQPAPAEPIAPPETGAAPGL
ncbi:MAG: PQQ-binding-like beta-propeller repeat protein [Armatimonadota bacterium]|nr:MAG: PQQ-binding-like beta-propeller repeat protein [Armatimonadota bacterium]